MSMRVGIDTGGTFTDLVAVDTATSEWRRAKVSSTPSEPLTAVVRTLEEAEIVPDQIELLVLGTTVGTNALLQRRGARVAYLASEGFEDVPFIQRGNRKFHYDLHWRKPKPFLDRRACLGVPERMDYLGAPERPLEETSLAALEAELRGLCERQGVDAVAVNLLFSYRNPEHEQRLGRWLEDNFPELAVSLSHRVAPVWREYERGITTIADAYLKPLLRRFILDVDQGLRERGFRGSWSLIRSNGGTRLAKEAVREPVQLLLSGLAGGVMAGKHFGQQAGRNLITLDMGGTSCDLAIITGGEQRYAAQFEVEFGLPLLFPSIEVSTIGAGGGSIAWIDRGGFLRVGPQSAGAEPGPACYGRGGTEATVTDANLVLGRLDPQYFLGGTVPLDPAAAVDSLARLGASIGMSPAEAALATIEIANENMVNAVRVRTVEVGIDPRGYCLVAFGGAGPLHAAAIARRLGIARVLVPPHPGLCSAFGALTADLRADRVATVSLRSDSVKPGDLQRHLERMSEEVCGELRAERFAGEPRLTARLAMRYVGQNYEDEVELPTLALTPAVLEQVFSTFEGRHKNYYGYQLTGEVIEIVNVTVTAVGACGLKLPAFHCTAGGGHVPTRSVIFYSRGEMRVPVFRREFLPAGWTAPGPAILEDPDSTTLVEVGDRVTVAPTGALSIEIAKEQS